MADNDNGDSAETTAQPAASDATSQAPAGPLEQFGQGLWEGTKDLVQPFADLAEVAYEVATTEEGFDAAGETIKSMAKDLFSITPIAPKEWQEDVQKRFEEWVGEQVDGFKAAKKDAEDKGEEVRFYTRLITPFAIGLLLDRVAAKCPTSKAPPHPPAGLTGPGALLDAAAAEGSTAAQLAARRSVAQSFYKEHAPWMSEAQINDHLKGIDFSKPVKVSTSPPPTVVEQLQVPGGNQGSYYGPPGSTPGQLGIGDSGLVNTPYGPSVAPKVATPYEVAPGTPVLESTAAPVTDTWSISPGAVNEAGVAQEASGGGQQYFIPNKSAAKSQ